MDTQKKLTQKNYSIIANLYIEDFEKDYQNFHFIDDAIKLRKIHKLSHYPIVDLGSGPGTVIDYMIKKDKHIRALVAVDFNESFCHRMNHKYIHNQNVKIVCEDLVKYVAEQKPSSIGVYIASFSLIHIPDHEIDALFVSIHKTLVKGGIFVFSCHRGVKKGMEQEPYQKIQDTRLKHESVLLNYMNYFTEHELRERLRKAKLEIIKMEVIDASVKIGEFDNKKIWVIAEQI